MIVIKEEYVPVSRRATPKNAQRRNIQEAISSHIKKNVENGEKKWPFQIKTEERKYGSNDEISRKYSNSERNERKKIYIKKKNIYMPWIVLRTWNGEQRRVGDRLGARNRALGRRSKVFPKVGLVDPATQRPILEGSTGQSLSSATTGWTPAWSILNYYYHYYFNFFVFF